MKKQVRAKSVFYYNFLFFLLGSLFSIGVYAQVPAGSGSGAGTGSGTNSGSGTTTPAPTRGGATTSTTGTTANGSPNNTQNSTVAIDPRTNLPIDNKSTDLAKTTEKEGTPEEVEEARKEAEKNRLRKKIFGNQIFNNEKVSFEPSEKIATPRDYTIGPGDNLTAYISGYSQAQYEVVVNSDGFAFIKTIGAVQLSGRTIEQAQKELIQRLAPYYVNLGMPGSGASTTLQLVLGQIRTIRVMVIGEVITPGTYSLSSLSTAMNALYATGGPNEIGTYRKINVVRRNKVIATLDLYEFLMDGTLNSDIRLQDNDVVQVGVYKKRVELIGNFNRVGLFELLADEPVSKAIEYAGGFTDNAYRDRIKILGLTAKERRIVDVKAADYDKHIPQNGDELTAEMLLNRFENMVSIAGPVFRPGQYSLDQNKTLLQLIKNAEGLTGEAFTGRINVVRTREDLSVENISLNLADIMNGKAEDLILMREDQIFIPSKFELREGAFIGLRGELNAGDSLTLPYTSNMTLEDAIIRASGFKESAATSQIEVVRRKRDVNVQSTSAQIAEIFLFDINRDLSIDGNDSRFILQPFDEILVRPASNYQPQTFVTLKGEVVNPGPYGIKTKDEKLSDLINRSGGLTAHAYVNGATLLRKVSMSEEEINARTNAVEAIADDAKKGVFKSEAISKDKKEAIGIDLARILRNPGGKEDIILQDGDIIDIPKRLETVRLQGELLLPTTVKYRNGSSFMDYVSQAGGFTRTSLKRKSYIIYPNGSIDRTRKFLFFNIYPKVEPGSEIHVPVRTASDLLEAQQALQGVINISATTLTLITTILAFRTFSNR